MTEFAQEVARFVAEVFGVWAALFFLAWLASRMG